MKLSTPLSVVIAGLLIALAIVFSSRYEVAQASGNPPVRIDRLTGSIDVCPMGQTESGRIVVSCTGRRP